MKQIKDSVFLDIAFFGLQVIFVIALIAGVIKLVDYLI